MSENKNRLSSSDSKLKEELSEIITELNSKIFQAKKQELMCLLIQNL